MQESITEEGLITDASKFEHVTSKKMLGGLLDKSIKEEKL
jgi:hypothetical protein